MKKLNVYVGWDSREDVAYQVCKHSLEKHSENLNVIPLKQNEIRRQQYYKREIDRLASTEFTYTRFFVPVIHSIIGRGSQWAVFCDCDFLFFQDLYNELQPYLNSQYAVLVVKHDYVPKQSIKMDGKVQHLYPRKNWSSFIVWNYHHPKNRQDYLTTDILNQESGQFLHQFKWLDDKDIGELPIKFNWLNGEYEKPASYPVGCHFTNGGPWFPDYQDIDYAEEWRAEYQEYLSGISTASPLDN